MIIIKLNVCMHTTSKISEGSLICLNTTQNFVKIGKAVPSLLVTRKDARDLNSALTVMVGKNNNFIP